MTLRLSAFSAAQLPRSCGSSCIFGMPVQDHLTNRDMLQRRHALSAAQLPQPPWAYSCWTTCG